MRTFFIVAACAVLLAAIIVELSFAAVAGQSALALLVLASLALVFQGYLSLRLARPVL